MQVLYAVNFDVQDVQSGRVYERLRRHLAEWLGDRGRVEAPSTTDLERDGRAILGGKIPGHGERRVSWAVAGDEHTRALRMTIHQPLSDGSAQFVTRVTISQSEKGGGLRIVMGREIPDGWIAPVQDPTLKRPNLLRAVLGDRGLEVRVLGQLTTGRYERIREEGHAAVLLESLALSTRLPILLVHPRDQSGWNTAAGASGQLAGLAQVVTLNYVTAQAVRRIHQQVAVPSGGARLVWPNLGLEHPAYSREEVSQPSFVGGRLMPSLSHLSVIARGSDTAWERARQASYRAAARKAGEQLARAQATGDTTAELKALKERTRQLEDDAKSWEDMAQSCMVERDKAQSEAAVAEALRQERNYWKGLYLDLSKGGSGQLTELDPWSEIPVLGTDAVPTFEALARTSEKRIVFTAKAARAWKASQYPHPQEMTDQLIALAQAAMDLYAKPGKMPRLGQWFYDNHGLKFANSDEKLSKNKEKRYFEFDGKRRDGLPHVKVRDAVSPNEVGRIYFAFDPEGRRLIVNHVGLHL
ncbi:hypothetical protein LUX12_02540 [Streptomyces somaliensis]|uniref:hypothetical protein n=1 Tax=Streptomyces somaliensis TaxID=78355 RepID=UPI0020CFAA3A|nr:hypothetical protein [Streptomyces somaliensis]MCP9943935.1 hypothetical protein [Streptomyces somaliensis]MCP9962822.1 hypothetical protein [Streptomyces somaliensis]MCP9975660.1 hypothetical protein [Streptomyces somaliensis]